MVKSYQWVEWVGFAGWMGWWMWWVGWLALNIYVLAPGILKMVHKVRLKMFSLKMVAYSMSLLLLSS